jgi:predicted Fe-S protein YdhL (DUF1289 family)
MPADKSAMAADKSQPVASPCIDICVLDENDICQGCYRSAREIGEWSSLDNPGRKAVVEQARRRRTESGGVF